MTHPLIGLIMLGISLMAGRRLLNGWTTRKMVLFGKYRDWGPFDRHEQPVRFWLATVWAAACTMTLPLWIWAFIEDSLT